jgi:asparagine synthase (glutamine-hydrolysing)
MCGIAGLIVLKSDALVEDTIRAFATALRHRGPDAGDTWVDHEAGFALAHRRLSILDLSPAGAQPMHSKCGRYVIVFNGEIYNFAELRGALAQRGAQFVGHSDTEVLLEGFSAWGVEETLKRTNGMFAIALWDRRERVLHLARDRLGEKPLYYGWHDGVFLFTSELKALHQWPGFRPEIDRDVLALYLRHNYVPDPYCIYRGFRKLQPGTFLTVTTKHNHQLPEPRAYWSLVEAVTRAKRDPLVIGRPADGRRRSLGRFSLRRDRFLDHCRADAGAEFASNSDFQYWFYRARVRRGTVCARGLETSRYRSHRAVRESGRNPSGDPPARDDVR